MPRRIKFETPGVPIDLAREPRLAAEIEAIARSLDEPMPSEVYLIPDANAFVAQPPASAGFKKRKVLAIGLPLLQTLNIFEFRALLAHEFAHFYSGDTRLGPVLYRGRATMVRVFENLGKKSEALQFLTRWGVIALAYTALMGGLRLYWTLFMRFTQLISRRQEFRSDEIACHLAGSESMASALRMVNRTGPLVGPYWQSVVFPLAARGFQPQIADSFGRFMATPHIAKAASDYLDKQIGSTKSDPFDTHPPLAARIAKTDLIAAALPSAELETGKLPAISLLKDMGGLEGELLRKLMPALKPGALKPLAWETCGAEVFVPMWRKEVAPFLPLLGDTTLASLPAMAKAPQKIAEKVQNPPGILWNKSRREARAMEILGLALSLAMIDKGWMVTVEPASSYVEHNGVRLTAHSVPAGLRSGAFPASTWEAFCAENGVGEWALAPVAS